DPNSGFCFGVDYAIAVAERELQTIPVLYCLGEIVHNELEVARLANSGLKIISHADLENLHDCRVLIRAHGEPPGTYRIAFENNIELIDASCPIVLHLEDAVYKGFLEMEMVNGQVVIYGKAGHAEVKGLTGQTGETAIVVGSRHDLHMIDFARPVRFFSQTTMGVAEFNELVKIIGMEMERVSDGKPADFKWNDSICRQVSNRSVHLRNFASRFDLVIFVSGGKSSNGLILYKVVQEVNPNTKLVSDPGDLRSEWFTNINTIGICGATSTPLWLMEQIGNIIAEINN
ncbi:MAG: 4-hydroxy-3-methylbut-2-enyl diphosphate reductase, partial [Bacteroidota bacterium]